MATSGYGIKVPLRAPTRGSSLRQVAYAAGVRNMKFRNESCVEDIQRDHACLARMLLVCLLVLGTHGAFAQQRDAKAVLKAMTQYVGSQKSVALTFDSDIEVITPQLEKIQFTNSGDVLLKRPDKLRTHRVGGYADVTLVFDGKTANVYSKRANG